jgi:hypothetical protein
MSNKREYTVLSAEEYQVAKDAYKHTGESPGRLDSRASFQARVAKLQSICDKLNAESEKEWQRDRLLDMRKRLAVYPLKSLLGFALYELLNRPMRYLLDHAKRLFGPVKRNP